MCMQNTSLKTSRCQLLKNSHLLEINSQIMTSKSFLYLSLLLFLVACKAQPPFFEEYEGEDEDDESDALTTPKANIKSSTTKSQSDTSNSTISSKAKQNKPKQEEIEAVEEETEPPRTTPRLNFGPQVASIITGALSGNLGTILSGSFNLVPNSGSRENVNKAWESIAGITPTTTTKRPTTRGTGSTTAATVAVTEAEDDDDEEVEGRIVI